MSSAHLVFSSSGVRPLAALAEGASGVVAEITPDVEGRADRLQALGVTPGAKITVLQTFPGIVFACDQTELAVERVVAEAIMIRPSAGGL